MFREHTTVASVFVGGTLATAKRFADGGHLHHEIESAVSGVYAVEYANERGLEQLAQRASAAVHDAEQQAAREKVDEFYHRLRDDKPVAYGSDHVRHALELGAVEKLLVTSSVDREAREELSTMVEQYGGEVVVVPTGYDAGRRFDEAFDGLGALLRFSVEQPRE